MLDDKFIFAFTPNWVFKILAIKVPLEYIIEEQQVKEQSTCLRMLEWGRSILSYNLLVR